MATLGVQERRELPWEWFEFQDRARPVGAGTEKTVGEGGGERVWKVEVDGWEVPFKVLRGTMNDACRKVKGRDEEKIRGKRSWLMLMHGMGLGIGTFRGVAPYLLETHDLILPDYAGFTIDGGRGGRVGCAGFKVFAESMWRIADAMGIETLSLGGNSLGGGLCLMAGILQPGRVEKMVLANPACYPQALPRAYRLARVPLVGELLMSVSGGEKLVAGVEYVGFVDKTKFEPELRGRYVQSLDVWENKMRLMEIMRCLPADARDFTRAGHLGKLGQLKMPVLVTWGGRDPLLVEGSGERLAAELGNAVFERHWDLAHMPHEEEPERVGKRWAEFLNGR